MEERFDIHSFKKTNTINSDTGKGVVRLATSRIGATKDFRRNDLVEISKENGVSIWAVVRGGSLNKEGIALEYDQQVQLGIQNTRSTILHIRKAGFLGWIGYFLKHPDPPTRLTAFFTIYVTALFTIVSIAITLKF
jgi:hypothetical protein